MNLKSLLNQLGQRKNSPAISILLPTHRTFPDNRQDLITLKNLIKETEERLQTHLDKREVKAIIDAINAEVDGLDHNYNLDSLGIFADCEEVTLMHFPFTVKQRVIIDDTFAIRDLVREINSSINYYILVISRATVRLIEAFDDRLVAEFDPQTALRAGSFPIDNTLLFAPHGLDRAEMPNDAGNLKQFFNRVDKSLQEVQNHPERTRLPVIVVGDVRNLAFFKEACDRPGDIVGEIDNVPELKAPAEKIIADVQSAAADYRRRRAEIALQHIAQARSAHQLLTDLSTMYRAIDEGNAFRLFVRTGYVQPGLVDLAQKTITPQDDPAAPGVTDDVVDVLIEQVLQKGGEVYFLSAEQLGDEKPLSLQTRY
ncbi:hypothetical protein [Nitrosomonas halophila]|jgi:hypothetical protein|uniref:Uncharacterized protein n=1 Tax=Nitrosomonas halophila TaxID=44576 RepID=A0A1H3GKK1_9PROT|nr:hypothetical protein [Nitrosomonas halophila]SDY03580.1 hypothetical protein SAMN05421881_101557 [Nitrosomonas halophila]